MSEHIRVSSDLENDSNYQKYLELKAAGAFLHLPEFAYVLFQNGMWINPDTVIISRDEALQFHRDENLSTFFTQPNAPEEIISIPSVFIRFDEDSNE